MKRTICVAGAAALVLTMHDLTGVAWAEEEKTEATIPALDEVVVTATKTAEKRRDVANAVVVKDADDIKESPAQGIGRLLANEPGIDWRTYGNYGGAAEEIHIRGMGGDATQVMVNGVVINSPSLGVADVSQIPLNSIEKIEVIKGSGSLLYGSGAMGGTVNIITKRPQPDKLALATEAGYGTQNTYRLSAENGMFIGEGFGYYLAANRKGTEGFRNNSDLQHSDASLNLLLNKGEQFDVSLYGDLVDRDYGVPGPKPPPGTQPFSINGEKFYDSESASLLNRGSDENNRAGLEVKSRLSKELGLRLKADHSVLENFNRNRYSWGTGDETTVTNTIKGLEGNVDLAPFSWLGLLAGSEYRDFNYRNKLQYLDGAGAPVVGAVTADQKKVFSQGTFAEFSLKPANYLKLSSGYRYEQHSRFGHEGVARYGMVVSPLADTVFKVNHGEHFKAPTLNDLFWPDDGFTKGNPDLKPETGWHTDFTAEQGFLGDRIFTSLSYFRWDLKDKIDWAEDPTQPTAIPGFNYWTPTNLFKFKATGWEMNARIRTNQSLILNTGLTILDAEEEKAPGVVRPARYKPDYQIKCDVTHFADFGLTSTFTARYTGDRPAYYQTNTDPVPKITLDSYWTVDAKVEQVVARHYRLAIIGTNLLDKDYDTYVSTFTDQSTFVTTQQPYPGAGRSILLQVGYEF